MFPKVLILTLLIFGTFSKDSIENIEERIEAIERKLAACTMKDENEDIGTNRVVLTSTQQQMINLVNTLKSFVKSELKPVKNDVKALTTALDTTTKLALENQEDVENLKTDLYTTNNLAIENQGDMETLKADLDTTTNLVLGNQGDVENLKTILDTTTNLAVIFSVKSSYPLMNEALVDFNQAEINIGDGFDRTWFTVPIDGIYKFTFSVQNPMFTTFRLFKNFDFHNGLDIMVNQDADDAVLVGNIKYSTWMMRLVKGDVLKMMSIIHENDITLYNYEYNPRSGKNNLPITFTGELIHID